ATGDRVPCVYVENQRVAGLDPADPIQVSFSHKVGDEPTGKDHPELLKMHPSHGHDMTIVNGISRIGYMSGGKAARWVDEELAPTLTRKAVDFITENKDHPFFLYFATHDIHVPRVPNARFAGKSGLGPRGDVILQFDWSVSEIVKALNRLKLADNTVLIITSDNGPVVDDGYKDQARQKLDGHKPAGPLRGGKYSAFEGGTRIPFLIRWPAEIKPGESRALVCQIDFLASFADLTGQKLGEDDAPDSMDVLPAFLGKSKTGREVLVEQGPVLALRKHSTKYIEPGHGRKFLPATQIETGIDPNGHLYDLSHDLGERYSAIGTNNTTAAELHQELNAIRAEPRSRP
ncbi:MAG TPA: sulfatase-like hydrolase/transferase, partial [Verrucomicrobiae bacterium]|nr:sulfatase-like hydrolase/transferase [Verrucomicrobiae bacterium]